MATTKAFAPAKINLTLHVTGQRSDGYHLLDSLVVFADVGDALTLTAGPDMRLSVDGPFAAGVPADARNLVWRAAERAGWSGHIHLTKNLPHGAGIGGGSSDAAAVLRALGHAHDTDGALSLGADVPVCLNTVPQRMTGIGEVLETVEDVPALPLVLVNPGAHVPTPEVFRALEHRNNPAMKTCNGWASQHAFLDWLRTTRNDMQTAAVSQAPVIADALRALGDATLARMSGSGATCFGIYPDMRNARNAAARLQQRHPEWWVQATETFGADQLTRATT